MKKEFEIKKRLEEKKKEKSKLYSRENPSAIMKLNREITTLEWVLE